jgi:hypothetical protein
MKMRLKAVNEEAEQLVRELGERAYDAAMEEALRAKRQKNARLQRYKSKVAMTILRLSRSVTAESE